ncbi:hypothetical protein EK21DRAFT_118639 [Setomelanomma holmii]|uniref:Uncharacterized protein n=1 Tax=Setomelanomma holmii TaxID=210430 RepID=A0A9P4LER1_9PLEO|nr:hypothetical protein EK21DRAFT_118639 [Setomelanomma holmii]
MDGHDAQLQQSFAHLTYITPRGETLTFARFQELMRRMHATMQAGGSLRRQDRHQMLWMLQQNHPNHAWLQGQVMSPPPNTAPNVLQHLGRRAGVQQQAQDAQGSQQQQTRQGMRQQEAQSQQIGGIARALPQASVFGQQSGPGQSPRWPNFAPTAPNMIPAGNAQYQQGLSRGIPGVQAGNSAKVDPRMATATLPQGLGYPTPSPSQASPNFAGHPSPTSPQSHTARPSSSGLQPQHAHAPKKSSPLASSFDGSVGLSAHTFHSSEPLSTTDSPQQLHDGIGATQVAGRARRPSSTSASSYPIQPQGSPPIPRNGQPNGPAPRMGMFQPPPSRPPSANGNGAQGQRMQAPPARDSKEGRLHSQASSRGVAHLDMSTQKFDVEHMTPEQQQHFKEMKQTVAARGRTKEEIALIQLHQSAMNRNADAAMSPPAQSASAGAQSKPSRKDKKRKDAPTSDSQLKKRQQTVDQLAREVEAAARRDAAEPNRGFHSSTIIINADKYRNPRPHIIVQAKEVNAHAIEHGVHMSDVELNNDVRKTEQAWLMNQEAIRMAQSLLDPSADRVARIVQQSARPQGIVYVAEPTIAAAREKVKDGRFDYTYSAGDVNLLRSAAMDVLERCAREIDGELRAPEEDVLNEQKADLLFAMGELRRDA